MGTALENVLGTEEPEEADRCTSGTMGGPGEYMLPIGVDERDIGREGGTSTTLGGGAGLGGTLGMKPGGRALTF